MARKPPVVMEEAKTMKAQYVLDVRHIQALREEAVRQAGVAMTKAKPGEGAPRPDASAVLRAILDDWMTRAAKR